MKKALLACTLMLSLQAGAEDIPGKTLLSYYSGSCKSSGQWTQTALADSQALIKTLDQMMKDTDCAASAGAISQLNALQSQLSTLSKLNDTKNSLVEIDAHERELLVQLSQTNDDSLKSEINTELRSLQVRRATLIGKQKYGEEMTGADKVQIMGQIATSANASFDMIASNQKCIDKNPGMLTTATSLMAGVGAAIAPINPAVGLLMTAGSVFTRSAIDGIRKNKLNKKIRTIADTTITLEAYSCALEKMSANWCQMQDAKSFIDFKSRNRIELRRNPTLANAISLNDREVPVLMDWLNKIRSGISPTTTSDAERQARALEREVQLKKNDGKANGLIEQSRKVYESSTDQWGFLKNNIITKLVDDASGTAMVEIYEYQFAYYYLSGIDDPSDARIRDTEGNIRSFSNWTKPGDLVVTLDSVKSRYQAWMSRSTVLVNRELAEVQQPDPLRTLTLANVESEPWQIRPLSAIRNITNFLKANLPKEPAYQKLYTDTITRLDTIHDVTASAVFIGETRGSADTVNYQMNQKSAIEIIYEEAQLNYGTIVLFDRLEMIIRISLLEYLKNASEEDQVLVAQLLASDRFSETLGKMSGTSSLARLAKDLKNGQAYTNENLSGFMDLFGHNINRTLGRLYQEEKQVSPTTAISKRDLRTSLCFLSLTAENASEWIDSAYCNGLKMEAVEIGGPETFAITDATFNLDLKDRMCVYHDYFRRSDIYQKSRIRTMRVKARASARSK